MGDRLLKAIQSIYESANAAVRVSVLKQECVIMSRGLYNIRGAVRNKSKVEGGISLCLKGREMVTVRLMM